MPLHDEGRRRLELLADLGPRLVEAADPPSMLRVVDELAVPGLADRCAVDLEVPPWAAAIVEDGRTVRIADVAALGAGDPVAAAIAALGGRSAVVAPLRARGRALGVIRFVVGAARRGYDEDDRAYLAVFASRVSMLLDHARALAAIERHADRTRRLQRVSSRLAGALAAREIAAIVLDEGAEALGAYSAGLWVLSDDRTTLALRGTHNYPEEVLPAIATIPVAASIPIAEAVRDGEPVWLESRDTYAARYPASEARTRDRSPRGDLAIACLPLRLEARVVGAIALSFTDARRFDASERTFLGLLADACAQALDRARLYDEARGAAERAAFLADAATLLAGTLDVRATMQQLAELAVPRIADWCAVDLAGVAPREMLLAVAHVDPEKVALAWELRRRWPPDPSQDQQGIFAVMKSGRSELHTEIAPAVIDAIPDPERRGIMRDLGLRSAMVVPLRASGRVVGAITLISAESGRRFGAADLAMAEHLGDRAGLAIANATLYEEAVRAVAVRDEFLSIAGHELKTPLTALMLQLEMLGRRADDATRERVDKVTQHATRLGRLVDELLDVSRISAGRLRLEREELDLAEVVAEHVARVREGGATVEIAPGGAVRGWWDRSRVEQIVSNLLGNAVKYGEGKPIDVRVEAADGRAVLVVRDRGIGIAPADQARIFERFERAVSSRHFGGLGLGLWIVRQIVEAHGGTIAVASAVGEGAELRVELPVEAPA